MFRKHRRTRMSMKQRCKLQLAVARAAMFRYFHGPMFVLFVRANVCPIFMGPCLS